MKLYSYEYVFPYNQEGPVHNEFVPLVASIGINGLTSVIEEDVRESQRTQRVQLTFATRAHRTDFLNNKEVVDELLGIARTLGLNKSRKIDVRITVPVVPS